MSRKNYFASCPLSAFRLLVLSCHAYFILLPHVLVMVVVSACAYLATFAMMLYDFTFGLLSCIPCLLLAWFLFTAILIKGNLILSGNYISSAGAMRIAGRRYLHVLGSNIIFFGVAFFVSLLLFALDLFFNLLNLHPFYMLFAVFLCFVVLVYLYFAVPVIALDKQTLLKGFEKSIDLVRSHFWHTAFTLGMTGALILGTEALGILFTGQHRLFFLTGYQFLLQVILYPFVVSVTLLLLQNLKAKRSEVKTQTPESKTTTQLV